MNASRSNSAFSLIEVMVAILILGIALTGLVHGITTALASNKESELQTIAALFADGKVEELRAEGFSDLGAEARINSRQNRQSSFSDSRIGHLARQAHARRLPCELLDSGRLELLRDIRCRLERTERPAAQP